MTQNQITSIKEGLTNLKPSIANWLSTEVEDVLKQISSYTAFQVVDEATAKSAAEIISFCSKAKENIEKGKSEKLQSLKEIVDIQSQALMKAMTKFRDYEYYIDSHISFFKEDVAGNKILAKQKKDVFADTKPKFELVSRFDYVKSLVDTNYKAYLKAKMEAAKVKLEEEMKDIRLQAEATKAKITAVAETPLQAITMEQNIDNAVDLQNSFLATLNKVPATTKTAMGGVQSRKNYSISSMDKKQILKWVLEHEEHLDLLKINEVYANANFKPKGDNNFKPLEVPGLVYDYELSLISK